MNWLVVDNVTGETIRVFGEEEPANWLCRGMNITAGPGGRFSVREERRSETPGSADPGWIGEPEWQKRGRDGLTRIQRGPIG